MKSSELINIYGGGFTFTATFLNSVSRFLNSLTDFGRTIGTVISMFNSGKRCN